MSRLGPEFIDVTWGAGGATSELTSKICQVAQAVYGIETAMHMYDTPFTLVNARTCTNMPREKIDQALEEAKAAGIQNIFALRGDPPRGHEKWEKVETGFEYAIDLVKYIRLKYGDYFCIGVAGYPEGHIDNPDKQADLLHLKAKVDAGADYIITQLFYDTEIFLNWLQRCRDIGITVPIIPGIMPIQSYAGFMRMTKLCQTAVPQYILSDLEPIKDDDQAVKEYGVDLAARMCSLMKANGVLGFHFYTLNLEKSTRLILEELNFVPHPELVKPLPWQPSLARNREKENVRPIFWRNRTQSYIMRTDSWDDFPNGRWGDSRSPAFGVLCDHGFDLKYPKSECLRFWAYPETINDISQVFCRFLTGEIPSLPWSDSQLSLESNVIRDRLVDLNKHGFWTVNSQPAVDGVCSSDTVFGWGPKNGYVYQKAYLELFIAPAVVDQLLQALEQYPRITYFVVNRQNLSGANAVTWGVFPDHEIIQPTIVEVNSFLAWKDEAFVLWDKWAHLYDPDSASYRLLADIAGSFYLVNIVDNDYKKTDQLFEILKNCCIVAN